VLTSDKNIVTVPYRVQWRARNAENFIFNVEEQERLVRVVTESAMREVVGQTPAQAVLASSNDSVAPLALKIAQDLLDSYQSGVTIETITTVAVQPPPEVAEAFAEVVRADQNRKQSVAEAQQYRNQKLQIVEGEAAKLIESANAYKASSVADAQGETARFLSVYDQYKGAKDVTRQRIFLETMERVLSQSSKVIVESDGKSGGVVPYLPLPEIQKRSSHLFFDVRCRRAPKGACPTLWRNSENGR
jgi:modulator of FtsH protease HflK